MHWRRNILPVACGKQYYHSLLLIPPLSLIHTTRYLMPSPHSYHHQSPQVHAQGPSRPPYLFLFFSHTLYLTIRYLVPSPHSYHHLHHHRYMLKDLVDLLTSVPSFLYHNMTNYNTPSHISYHHQSPQLHAQGPCRPPFPSPSVYHTILTTRHLIPSPHSYHHQ